MTQVVSQIFEGDLIYNLANQKTKQVLLTINEKRISTIIIHTFFFAIHQSILPLLVPAFVL